MEKTLLGKFQLKEISKEEYDEFRAIQEPLIFPDRFDIHVSKNFSEKEITQRESLKKNLGTPFELRLGFFSDQKMIGWSYGFQITEETFRMATSGIIPEFQNKGIYSSFLLELKTLLGQEGFQIIQSRHYATDNQVIIPKLKASFVISGLEISDEYGLLLILRYFFNETRKKVMHVRSGYQQADQSVTELIRKYSN